jgi:hypothetical protein
VIFAQRAIALLLTFTLTAAAFGQTVDVDVELGRFGAGSAYRPGDFVGIRVQLTSNLDEPVQAWVQVEIPNADGDIAEYGRSVSLTRGAQRPVWLYAPLPPTIDNSSVLTVRVFEMRDGRRRRELGGTRILPPAAGLVDMNTSIIGVVGNMRMELDDLAAPGPRSQLPVAAHESTRVVSGLKPDQLPDQWEGLRPFEAITWTNADPTELRQPSAEALVEYVRRGGHLIICLEEAGNRWGLGDDMTNVDYALWQILPQQQPTKHEGVMLSELLPVLGKALATAENVPDIPLSILTFDELPADTTYEPLIKTPDGQTIVVQRRFGFGRVTVIGVNVGSGQLNNMLLDNGSTGLPQGDVFWGRILGRRADAPTSGEIRKIEDDERINAGDTWENQLGGGRLFAEEISMTQRAGLGLFLAFILFVIYWLVAGPGCYYVLKHFHRVQHTWLAFGAAAGLFTAIAWGVVSLIPTTDVTVRHLTYLDRIARTPDDPHDVERNADADPQLWRGTSWLSVYLDDYRDTEVAIASADDQRDLLATWAPPGMSQQTFPNVARYQVDIGASPSRYELPGRSTATQLYAHWLGVADLSQFGKMIQVDPNDPIRVVIDSAGNETSLAGTLINDFPETLRNVKIIWVKNRRLISRQYAQNGDQVEAWVNRGQSGQMLNAGLFWIQPRWSPGEKLSLGTPSAAMSLLSQNIKKKYVEPYIESEFGLARSATSLDSTDRANFLDMLSIFHQLTPPEYLKVQPDDPDSSGVRFYRQLGRELDLSSWFNRPCIIILATMHDSPTPVPIEVGGETVESEGTTIVRWIYPLPLEEQVAFAKVPSTDE